MARMETKYKYVGDVAKSIDASTYVEGSGDSLPLTFLINVTDSGTIEDLFEVGGTIYPYNRVIKVGDVGGLLDTRQYNVDKVEPIFSEMLKENTDLNVFLQLISSEVNRSLGQIKELNSSYDIDRISEDMIYNLVDLFKIPFDLDIPTEVIRIFLKYFMKIRKIRGLDLAIKNMVRLCGYCDNWGINMQDNFMDVSIIKREKGSILIKCNFIKNKSFLDAMLKKVIPAGYRYQFIDTNELTQYINALEIGYVSDFRYYGEVVLDGETPFIQYNGEDTWTNASFTMSIDGEVYEVYFDNETGNLAAEITSEGIFVDDVNQIG